MANRLPPLSRPQQQRKRRCGSCGKLYAPARSPATSSSASPSEMAEYDLPDGPRQLFERGSTPPRPRVRRRGQHPLRRAVPPWPRAGRTGIAPTWPSSSARPAISTFSGTRAANKPPTPTLPVSSAFTSRALPTARAARPSLACSAPPTCWTPIAPSLRISLASSPPPASSAFAPSAASRSTRSPAHSTPPALGAPTSSGGSTSSPFGPKPAP